MVERIDTAQERLRRPDRRLTRAGQPSEDILIRHVEKRLEGAELIRAELGEMRIGETAEEQVDLAHAAVPRAEAQPFPANGKVVFACSHFGSTK
jgi:hypothetical protein